MEVMVLKRKVDTEATVLQPGPELALVTVDTGVTGEPTPGEEDTVDMGVKPHPEEEGAGEATERTHSLFRLLT